MATGVPIITHTEGPLPGVAQAEFLLKEGADPKKIMIGHVSNSKDIEYHKAILAKGTYIAFDRIGLDIITPMAVNVKNVADLCKAGFTEKIMLSHDTVNWLGRPPRLSGGGQSGICQLAHRPYLQGFSPGPQGPGHNR